MLNAYIAPRVERYLRNLEDGLRSLRRRRPTLHVMQSNGGITTAAKARRQPIQTLLSGPVGGTIGGAALSRATGRPNLLCVDMGGTSFDLSLIVDGSPTVSTETELEGLPGADAARRHPHDRRRGGSIAWLEAGGLRVGPQSAGAMPGPACYGRGGTEPTVTDANLFLGRLEPDVLPRRAHASRRRRRRAGAALGRRARSGSDDTAFAEGVLAIVNANMADAMRTITVKQGIDPRDYALVAFGGAGPMHAAWLAEELEIGEVIIPWSPGCSRPGGCSRPTCATTSCGPSTRRSPSWSRRTVEGVYEELAAEGAELLARGGGRESRPLLRAHGGHALRRSGVLGERAVRRHGVDLGAIDAAFHDAHRVRYGHSTPGAPVEFVNLRLAAFGRIADGAAPFQAPDDDVDPRSSTPGPAIFGGEPHETSLVLRDRLLARRARSRGPR